jgi:membrane-associated phospholipid phosphatase
MMNENHSTLEPIYDISNKYPHQPEIFLTADKLTIVPILLLCFSLIFQKNRKICLIYVYSSLLRSISLLVTSLPLRNHHHDRVKYKNLTIMDILIKGMLGETSGDYFFSGHTMMYTTFALLLYNIYPNKKGLLIGLIYMLIGIMLVFISGEHYTIDIIFGAFVPYAFSKILN